MKGTWILLGYGCADLLLGCASIPPLPSNEEVNILYIQRAIECEINSAYETSIRSSQLLSKRKYTAKLELQVTDTYNSSAGVSLAGPLTAVMGEKVGFSMSGGIDQEAFRGGEVNFSGRLSNVKCIPPLASDRQTWLLGGSTGLREWLDRLEKAAQMGSNNVGSIGYILKFTYKPSGKIEPKFTLVPIPLDNLVPSATLTAARNRLYRLTITLVALPGAAKPTDVELTEDSAKKIALALAGVARDEELRRKQQQQAELQSQLDELLRRIDLAKAELENLPAGENFLPTPEQNRVQKKIDDANSKLDSIRNEISQNDAQIKTLQKARSQRISAEKRKFKKRRQKGLSLRDQIILEELNTLRSISSDLQNLRESQ